MAQLLVRPALNDHLVLADLLAAPATPTLRPHRPPIGQVVADAHIAVQRPSLRDAAHEAGVPFLVDPNTPLLQAAVAPKDRWASLPFAVAEPMAPADIDIDRLVEEVVQFQVEQGATQIIAPYLYATDPEDQAFAVSLRLLAATARYLDHANLPLPVLGVFCAQLNTFGPRTAIDAGLGRFLLTAVDHEVASVGLCLSPLGAPGDSYAKLVKVSRLTAVAAASPVPALAWRQGIYGPAFVAAGLDGYETGIGSGEQTNIMRQQANRREKPEPTEGAGATKKRAGGGGGVYLDTLGRSVPRDAAQVLLHHQAMQGKVSCTDGNCCASIDATLERPRHHAVRTRARLLTELSDQPHRRWRLHHVASQTEAAMALGRQANRLLEAADVKYRIGTTNLEALAQVLRELAAADDISRTA